MQGVKYSGIKKPLTRTKRLGSKRHIRTVGQGIYYNKKKEKARDAAERYRIKKRAHIAFHGLDSWKALMAFRKKKRQEAREEREKNYKAGTHTKRGHPRKRRLQPGNCDTQSDVYKAKIESGKRGGHYYIRQNKHGKEVKKYCKYLDMPPLEAHT